MPATKPKVWDTNFISHSQNSTRIDYQSTWDKMDYLNDYEMQIPTPRNHAPDFLHFNVYDLPERKKAALPDMFKVINGLIVVSQRFCDLLQDFDLGKTRLFEVPLYEYNQKDRRPGTYYILHIGEQKTSFLPDESTGLESLGSGETLVWMSDVDEDKLALSKDAALTGVDLWMEAKMRSRIFFSDRLKMAIKDHKITASSLKMRPCKLIG